MRTVLDTIGCTPTVRLRQFEPPGCRLYANLAYLNPTGSIKDVMARHMFERAVAAGRLQPGYTILEATTGNTGIAFALLAALHGYRFVAVMPAHMSIERRQIMRAFGAEVVLTPAEADMAGALARYRELAADLAGQVWLPDQFGNADNIEAHLRNTGTAIVSHIRGRIDAFVAGIGTGGTFFGGSRKIREHHPACVRIAVEPAESAVLSRPDAVPRSHGIQGIGEGLIPPLVARYRTEIDRIEVVATADAEDAARQLVRREGVFAGVSAGANVVAATRFLATNPGATAVTVVPDDGGRYLNQGLFGCSPRDCAEHCRFGQAPTG